MNLVLLIMALPSRISHSSLNTKHTWGLGGHSCDYVTIVMVSPGTHVEKNHESHSRTIEPWFNALGLYVTKQLI